jgi:3'-phosphoadenosine 5'-phosphosulfate sulfotransferase (PAPS reductase)/FAD synthetase
MGTWRVSWRGKGRKLARKNAPWEEATLRRTRISLRRHHVEGPVPSTSTKAPLTPHLARLEAESIGIIREVAAAFRKPVMLYSIGKDSGVMLHLALKAFAPGKPPFPLMHVDTLWKFREMIAFRDMMAKQVGMELLVPYEPRWRRARHRPDRLGLRTAHAGDEDGRAEAGARQIRLRCRLRRRAAG